MYIILNPITKRYEITKITLIYTYWYYKSPIELMMIMNGATRDNDEIKWWWQVEVLITIGRDKQNVDDDGQIELKWWQESMTMTKRQNYDNYNNQ